MKVNLHVSGFCVADASLVNPTRKKENIRFHAAWMHIEHEQYGHILVDTGYSKHFFKATSSFPGKIYGMITPVTLTNEETAVATLARKNIAPADVKYVIITHFHADHISALRDFPNAKFICSRASLDEVDRLGKWRSVTKGILKSLLPDDFHKRVLVIEDMSAKPEVLDGGLEARTFFDDAAIKFVYVPGHATGMVGLLIKQNTQTMLYAADAQWDKAAFNAGILPKKIVKLIFSSWKDFLDTTNKLKLYMAANPDTLLLFTHCEQTLKYVK